MTEDTEVRKLTPDLVLDAEGNAVHSPAPTEEQIRAQRPRAFAWSMGPIMGTVFLGALLVAGFTLFGVIVAIVMAIWLIRGLWNLLGLPSARSSVRRRGGSYNVYFRTGK